MSRLNREQLLDLIFGIIISKGIKEMTMSSIASDLGISKKTLYELFDSKSEMVIEAFHHQHEKFQQRSLAIIESAPDMMSAMTDIYRIQRDFLCKANVKLFTDLSDMYPEIQSRYNAMAETRMKNWEEMYRRGVEQGVFRPNVNLRTLTRLLHIQMEALKRMEEVFPADVTLTEVYDTICSSFLRSISSKEGLERLDNKDIK